MELRKLLMNEVDAAALRRMSNPSPPSSAPLKKQVSVRPSQDAVAATSHADDNEMDQCWDSESEDSPMNSGPLDLNSLAVYVANQTTIDGTLEAIRALRGQETRINSVNFPSEAEKDKYQHFLRELMEEATRKSTPASQGAKKQRTTNDAIESSTNRFNNLSVDEREEYISDDEDVTTPPPKKQYAPPITIDNIQNSTTLLKKLKNLTQLNLTGKLIGSSLRVYPQTAAAYHQIRSFISQENLQHYTYQLPEDKMIRAVIRGMPIDTPVQEILQDLDELNIHAEECHIMTNKRNDTPMPLFLVTLKKTDENKEIFNLTEIDFNAKHRSWNNGQPNPTGTKIYNLTQSSDLDILVPNEPTRIPPNARSRPATIDFAITKGLSNTAIWTEPLLSSDHNPIFVTIQLQHHSKPRSTKLFTNWFKFQSILDSSIEGNPKISKTDEINSSIAQFTENITQAINQSSKNRALRIIASAPVCIPRRVLHDDLRIPSIPNQIRKNSVNFQKSVRLHSNPSIQQQTDPGPSTTYRFPHLATQCPSLFPD
ncbi:nucleic-acid-binding protein from transposon X-element [Nephila pilipes]|uniref:Nucleic-acid-binding protein from transposon X-element n=1 Tax=Nephila pilipes TaxID=299642 RepID=A0A8X6NJM1_NEPPI|nr:nucleic-acid-binding protein from transposon X-element [Nephila pilipes]